MNQKVSPCYKCYFQTKPIVEAGNEKLALAIQTFGEAIVNCKNLKEKTKDEMVGILNAIVSSYPSSSSIPVVFDTFSQNVFCRIENNESLKNLWEAVVKYYKIAET